MTAELIGIIAKEAKKAGLDELPEDAVDGLQLDNFRQRHQHCMRKFTKAESSDSPEADS